MAKVQKQRTPRIFYNAIKVASEMMEIRGYKPVSVPPLPPNLQEFELLYITDQENLVDVDHLNQVWVRDGQECRVYFFANALKEMYERNEQDKVDGRLFHCIIVSEKELSSKELENLEGVYNMENFTYEMIFSNPLKHVLQPKFTPLTLEESRRYLAMTGLKGEELPVLKSTDSVVRFLGLVPGQVVRVEREAIINGRFDPRTVVHRMVHKE